MQCKQTHFTKLVASKTICFVTTSNTLKYFLLCRFPLPLFSGYLCTKLNKNYIDIKEWNGIVRELIDRKADIAVASMTINFARLVTHPQLKVIMQGKLFQRCTHLLYCGVLSLGGNVNTRQMSQSCHSLTWDPSFT